MAKGECSDDISLIKPCLPEMIGGHPWFLFVDPAISAVDLNYVQSVLDDDQKWMKSLFEQAEEPEETQ